MSRKDLKYLRKSKGLLQKTIAIHIGIPINTWLRYENGLTNVPVGMLIPLAREFQISVSSLLEVIAETQNG